jgi:4-deoxy-L-threo-5-hexosulose-uronate ketol-isomerase
MDTLTAHDDRAYARMSSDELRSAFLVGDLFQPGRLALRYWETDRTVVGGAMPTKAALTLPAGRELAAAYFCERRELGVINVGGTGTVEVDGQRYELGKLDCLYVGRGAKKIAFRSARASQPANFYLLSYPAHTAYPTTLARHEEIDGTPLGSADTANDRVLYKFIHPGGIPSCQLVMGVTLLKTGSIWNTMPPHTHMRRSEVYLYFDVQPNAAVFHFMGRPDETRHLIVRDRQAVLSPPWSIHSGAGTDSYGFIWGMGGENQDFADMDPAPLNTLR